MKIDKIKVTFTNGDVIDYRFNDKDGTILAEANEVCISEEDMHRLSAGIIISKKFFDSQVNPEFQEDSVTDLH